MKRKIHLAWITALLMGVTPSLFAQRVWDTDNGDWNIAENWVGGVPADVNSTAGDAAFGISGNSPNASVAIGVADAAYARIVRVGQGKTVTLNLQNGASIANTAAPGSVQWNINIGGTGTGTGTGESHLTVNGPGTGSASVTFNQFILSSRNIADAAAGNTLTFSGAGLSVATGTAATASVVGRYSNDNVLTVSNKASVQLHGIWISQNGAADLGKAVSGNKVVVDDATLTVNGASGNNTLLIGSQNYTATYANAIHDNSITVRNGGTMTLSSGAGFTIGNAANSRANYLRVTDNGTFDITATSSTIIGNSAGTNLGGNFIQVDDGGKMKTTGTLTIYSHASADPNNEGANRLVVGNGGTFAASGLINNSGSIQLDPGAVFTSSNIVNINDAGLLQLSSGATLEGKSLGGSDFPLTINVKSGGRFEAAGSGLASNVASTVESAGTFSLGLAEAPSASTLNLNSALTLNDGSIFEVTIFGEDAMGSMNLGASASVLISGDAVFKLLPGDYTPVNGDSWTLFSGDIGNISGMFDLENAILPVLDNQDLSWALNLDGSVWKIAVIPEPGTFALLGFAGMAGLFLRRRKG